jgi:hypothetical protein
LGSAPIDGSTSHSDAKLTAPTSKGLNFRIIRALPVQQHFAGIIARRPDPA